MTDINVHRFKNGNQGEHSVVATISRVIHKTKEPQRNRDMCCSELVNIEVEYIKLQDRMPVVRRQGGQPYVMVASYFPEFPEERKHYWEHDPDLGGTIVFNAKRHIVARFYKGSGDPEGYAETMVETLNASNG